MCILVLGGLLLLENTIVFVFFAFIRSPSYYAVKRYVTTLGHYKSQCIVVSNCPFLKSLTDNWSDFMRLMCRFRGTSALSQSSRDVVVGLSFVMMGCCFCSFSTSWRRDRHFAPGSEGLGFESWHSQVNVEPLGKALYKHV